MVITYLVGLAPTGSLYVNGWLRGAASTFRDSAPPVPAVQTAAPALIFENKYPTPELLQLTHYLASEPQAGREVLFYTDTWGFAKFVGVQKSYFSNDDFLHSEERGTELAEFLHAHQDAIVVMYRHVYDRLYGNTWRYMAAIVVMAITYLVGLAPTGSLYVNGWLRGAASTFRDSAPPVPAVQTAAPALIFENKYPTPELLQLTHYLASEPQAGREVLFYTDTWGFAKFVGVQKSYFSNDDFLHSEERGTELAEFLHAHQDAIVVMYRHVYDRLYGNTDPDVISDVTLKFRPTITKRIASILSTVHYRGVELEAPIKEARWTRTVGKYVRQHYAIAAEFGHLVVLERGLIKE